MTSGNILYRNLRAACQFFCVEQFLQQCCHHDFGRTRRTIIDLERDAQGLSRDSATEISLRPGLNDDRVVQSLHNLGTKAAGTRNHLRFGRY